MPFKNDLTEVKSTLRFVVYLLTNGNLNYIESNIANNYLEKISQVIVDALANIEKNKLKLKFF